jgi:hypothetical protein
MQLPDKNIRPIGFRNRFIHPRPQGGAFCSIFVKDFASSEAHEYNVIQGEAILKSCFAGCSSNDLLARSPALRDEGRSGPQTPLRGKVK